MAKEGKDIPRKGKAKDLEVEYAREMRAKPMWGRRVRRKVGASLWEPQMPQFVYTPPRSIPWENPLLFRTAGGGAGQLSLWGPFWWPQTWSSSGSHGWDRGKNRSPFSCSALESL